MRKVLAISLALAFLTAASVFAGAEARMVGKIIDAETKLPVPGATIVLESTGAKNFKQEVKGKDDGTFAIFVLDGTIPYKFTFSAPGYAPWEESIKLKIGQTSTKEIALLKGNAAPGGVEVPAADPAVLAYNAGADLANSGDSAGAIAKFEEAVAAKPELVAAWIALARTQFKVKNSPKAIEAAKKVIEVDDSDSDMWTVLYQSYVATGDKANAAVAEKKLPANAGSLFNEGARLINAGKDDEAEKVLLQAISLDEKFAQAHYELGMVYVRTGKTAEAKASLAKYLELDPSGKDAATAREMMKYLQ